MLVVLDTREKYFILTTKPLSACDEYVLCNYNEVRPCAISHFRCFFIQMERNISF